MKKKLSLLVVLLLILGLTGCGNNEKEEADQVVTSESTTDTTEVMVDDESHEDTSSENKDGTNKKDGVADNAGWGASDETTQMESEESVMTLKIDETPVQVVWEENESVEALKSLAGQRDITIQMSMYGGFEQVGLLGESLPKNDEQITTNSGDIVLYSGNQIVVFYGSNSWTYTRLGHISDKDASQMEELLSKDNVTITISAKE